MRDYKELSKFNQLRFESPPDVKSTDAIVKSHWPELVWSESTEEFRRENYASADGPPPTPLKN